MAENRRTPFYALQAAAGARFVPFAGYDLPVQFSGVIAEHQAVRRRVGLFDVSHMGEVVVAGPQALAALQSICTNDVAKLRPGRALYTVMCQSDGGIIDDLIVYCESATRYFLCVNASRRAVDVAHMTRVAAPFACSVEDVSDQWAQLAVQGPLAGELIKAALGYDVSALPTFAWSDVDVAGLGGARVRVARTGYTGELGCELYVDAAADGPAEPLWRALVAAGAAHGLALCGLGARDTLRLEMKYPLYGQDIDLTCNPFEAGLGWVVKLTGKGDFVGRAALEAVAQRPPVRQWVGFKMLERGGAPRHGYAIVADGKPVGEVTSGSYSPSLGEGIGVGYVPAHLAAPGTPLAIMIRNQAVAAHVVATPFYRPPESR